MKRKYSVLNRRNNTQDEKIITATKKLRLFDFKGNSERKSALDKSEDNGKLKLVCTMDKSGYQ
ncbi:hypothetical protein lpari_03887 [Legionella parisiensis]|uniref:Uncharacterized protein n=3 Tax=Legionella parisiensis TaxID=45071 RepID=A0A1E5JKN8_9GAMM|nr:hypothetical protein [Legionella parisiensis]OEH45117.1 hypothetical protein lpari_03887 [Legionella parisiensis]